MKKTILIADDNPASRELLRIILEHCGHCVFQAADGAAALLHAEQHKPDLVILDIQMPRFDGFKVLTALRSNPQFYGTPIMALTASATPGDRDRILGAGFSDHFTKPIVPARLREVVAGLLAKQ